MPRFEILGFLSCDPPAFTSQSHYARLGGFEKQIEAVRQTIREMYVIRIDGGQKNERTQTQSNRPVYARKTSARLRQARKDFWRRGRSAVRHFADSIP